MPRIPMPGIPSVQAAPVAGARVDSRTFTAPYMAKAQVGNALGQTVAGAISDYQQKTQRVKDAGDLAKARLEMAKAEADIDQAMEADADFDKWETTATDRVRQARAAIFEAGYSKTMSSEVKRQLEADVELWATRTGTGVKYRATQARNRDGDKALTTLAQLHYNNGDKDQGDALMDQREALGLATKNETDVAKIVGQQAADVARAKSVIMANPFSAEEWITEDQFPSLSKADLLSLQKTAREEASAARAQEVRDLQLAVENGEAVDNKIESAVQGGRITPQQGKWLRKQATGTATYADDVVRAYELSRRIGKLQPDDKFELNRIAGDMAGLPAHLRNPLETELRATATPDPDKIDAKDGNAYIDDMFDANLFGNVQTHTDVTAKKAKATKGSYVDEQAWAKANDMALRLKTELHKFLQSKGGKATPLEQKQYIDGLIREQRATDGAVDLSDAIPTF